MRRSGLAVLVVFAVHCTGRIGDGGDEGPNGGKTETSSSPWMTPHIGDHHTAIGVRRLTRLEYGSTVLDLLGVANANEGLNEDPTVSFLSNNAHALKVGLSDVEAYARAAESASTAALDKLKLPEGCALDTLESECVDRFLADFLLRAFRRPPVDAQRARYRAVYDKVLATEPPREALRAVIESVLMAPHFLYRNETGNGGRLTSYELASRLSYLVWGTMPDASLFAAAAADELVNPVKLEGQLRRMLADPRAEAGVLRFASQWLGFAQATVSTKGQDIIGGLPKTLQSDLEEETRRFVVDALLGPTHSLRTLLSSNSTFVNATVAGLYGVDGVTGTEFRRVTLDPRTRRGVLTHPLIIATHSKESGYSVVQMGRFVRERLLCQEVPPPPPGVSTVLPEDPATENLPFREKFAAHSKNGVCRACHQTLDPPGWAYLPYDPIGRYKSADPMGHAFDTTGTLHDVDGKSHDFTDSISMIDILENSQEVKACFARQYLQYAMGRTLAGEDLPLYQRLTTDLVASNGDFIGLISSLVRSPEFGATGPTK